ncbi:MAG: mechanosensitive ion channel [Oscillospiraceae bacterium]|nr:mechanosensitive ion channel [Oscillospiraceae bacterium]
MVSYKSILILGAAGKVSNLVETAVEASPLDELHRSLISKTGESLVSLAIDLFIAILILLVGFRLAGWAVRAARKVFEKAGMDESLQTFLLSAISIVSKILVGFMAVTRLGIATSSIIAVLGSAMLAIGMSLQGSLSNIAGGVVLLLVKPFAAGDYIVEEGTGKEGYVTAVGLVYTTLRTIDNKVIMVPNGALAASAITNYTAEAKRIVQIYVGVEYSEDIGKVRRVIEDVVRAEPARLEGEEIKIYVHEFADSSINMGIRFWVKTEDYYPSLWGCQERLKTAFDENAISIPFPQVDVHLDGGNS